MHKLYRLLPVKNLVYVIRRYSIKYNQNKSDDALLKHIQSKIKFSGPITVHEFMKEVLTNPVSGYYMKKNALGDTGDFVTSPEISQMFGELVGIWIYNEWHKMGSPTPFQLVEFGPGTGSLMEDVLRTLKQLKVEESELEIHLIEKSPLMSNLQEEKLCGTSQSQNVELPKGLASTYKSSRTTEGIPIHWHYHFSCVPSKFSMMLAHEFFDALPVHKLKRTEDGWREILVDTREGDGTHSQEEEEESSLRYVISRGPTPASKLYVDKEETRTEVEVCPEAGVLMREIGTCIKENGGALLVVDYGHFGTEGDTFRAFRRHKQVSPLIAPGDCDLTCDVDFSYLKKQVTNHIMTFGPVSQGFFLKNMGIELRLKKLLQFSTESRHKSLIAGYNMLVERQQMGERFKVMAFLPAVMKKALLRYPPAGFYRSFTGE